ncbi:MAG: hypothetical protein ACKOF9_06085, partial [Burkholderiales bacterium]
MKTSILLASLVAVVALTACGKKEEVVAPAVNAAASAAAAVTAPVAAAASEAAAAATAAAASAGDAAASAVAAGASAAADAAKDAAGKAADMAKDAAGKAADAVKKKFFVVSKKSRSSERLFCVRPAWAHSCGCKSRHELVTASEVKRNCMRVTECGKEAWSINREPMD